MKTPIQELIDITKKRQEDDEAIPFMYNNRIIELAESLLDKEKEAIQQAFYEGMLCQRFDPNMGRAKIYYTENFGD